MPWCIRQAEHEAMRKLTTVTQTVMRTTMTTMTAFVTITMTIATTTKTHDDDDRRRPTTKTTPDDDDEDETKSHSDASGRTCSMCEGDDCACVVVNECMTRTHCEDVDGVSYNSVDQQ